MLILGGGESDEILLPVFMDNRAHLEAGRTIKSWTLKRTSTTAEGILISNLRDYKIVLTVLLVFKRLFVTH